MTCQRDRWWNKGGGKASVITGAGERQERSNIRSLEEDGSRAGNDAIKKRAPRKSRSSATLL